MHSATQNPGNSGQAIARHRRLLAPRLLALASAMLAACAHQLPPDDDWVAAVVAGEPMFGGGAALEQRLLLDPGTHPAGDALQRQRHFAAARAAHDAAAAQWVREHVPAALAREVLPFLHSGPGSALAAAETLALALFPWQGDDFPRQALRLYGDPRHAGMLRIQEQLADVGPAMARGGSPSPAEAALLAATRKLRPADSEAIAAFADSELGRRWCEQLTAAFPAAQERYRSLRAQAFASHFLRNLQEQTEDLILPEAKLQEHEDRR